MNAFASDAADLAYSLHRPFLIAATSGPALARAEQTALEADVRIGAKLEIGAARERLEHQSSTAGLWIEVDRDPGPALDELLKFACRDSETRGYGLVVSAPAELLDAISSIVGDSDAELMIDAGEAERHAALAVAAARRAIPLRVCDSSSDRSAERLRQLSEEVGRIASTLARLSADPAPAAIVPLAEADGEVPEIPVATIRNIIRARRLRARYFADDLFADPAWDMLLDLLQAELAQLRVPVSSLCISAAVPATTALRWIKKMVSEGLFVRRADVRDARRVFVELAPQTSLALRRYFAELDNAAVV